MRRVFQRRALQGRALLLLGLLDIGDGCRDGRKLWSRKAAESVDGGDVEEARDAALGGRGIEHCGRLRRGDPPQHVQHGAQIGVLEGRLRQDEFARVDTQDVGEKALLRGLADVEGARRDVDPGEGILRFAGLAHAPQRHEIVGVGRREQPVLGDGARRDETHDIALDHRFGAALPGLRRILDLLADGDPVTESDQLLEIVVGGVDRDTAHRNVLALVLAALGQRDAERPAGDFGVVKEQLVEIAHAVEEQ